MSKSPSEIDLEVTDGLPSHLQSGGIEIIDRSYNIEYLEKGLLGTSAGSSSSGSGGGSSSANSSNQDGT